MNKRIMLKVVTLFALSAGYGSTWAFPKNFPKTIVPDFKNVVSTPIVVKDLRRVWSDPKKVESAPKIGLGELGDLALGAGLWAVGNLAVLGFNSEIYDPTPCGKCGNKEMRYNRYTHEFDYTCSMHFYERNKDFRKKILAQGIGLMGIPVATLYQARCPRSCFNKGRPLAATRASAMIVATPLVASAVTYGILKVVDGIISGIFSGVSDVSGKAYDAGQKTAQRINKKDN